jgi:ATP-dependent Clp protease protease subunit
MSDDGGMSIQDFVESKLETIYVGSFTEESAKEFYENFMRAQSTGQTIVPIIIDSYGGSADAAMSMMDVIAGSDVSIATVAIGKAMSAGAILLSCGSEGMRFAAPGARIMVHNMGSFTIGKEPEIQADAKETARFQKYLYNRMAKNCGLEKDFFLKELKERGNVDWFLTPQEAKKINLINHIKIPRLHTAIAIYNEMG